MGSKTRRSMFVMALIAVGFIMITAIFKDAIQGWRNWIDLCVIEQGESTGERCMGVRDYCLAKYRQTR